MNNRLLFMLLATVLMFSETAFSKNDKEKSLPPGLQKKVNKGEPLPPGWQKKLVIGETLDKKIYEQGNVIVKDIDNGLVTIKVEGKLIKLIENTREIVEILDGL